MELKWIHIGEALPEPFKEVLFWEKWMDDPFVGYLTDFRQRSGKREWAVSTDGLGIDGDACFTQDCWQEGIEYWAEIGESPYRNGDNEISTTNI